MEEINASVFCEQCENCECEFEDGDEYWWVCVSEEEEAEEHVMLCDSCYTALLEAKGIPKIIDSGDNGGGK